ncbi:MAG: 16S rRNA (uracil(1498)-N(3))-methyltransferase [Endomicrobium sp.]|jgi:16S rRNA (uracil1498-N3)-methyltransferase|nr:16S rRNA (uracil(1498)-N(3))-methyltransferase [Endomicrobium sp.]
MSHFYVKPEDIKENTFTISSEQAHYISTVRRFKSEDEIMIFDGIGNSYKAKIISINRNIIIGNILSSSYKMPKIIVKLYTSIPKGDRFEWLIEKCAEIGVSEIVPINTKRSVKICFSRNKLDRYVKISIAASSQCGRNDIMKINEPIDFKTACKKAVSEKYSMNILSWEGESKVSLNNLLVKSTFYGTNAFIGPEGGFENEEVDFAKSLNIQTITLGDNILRVETAAIVTSILVLNSLEIIK